MTTQNIRFDNFVSINQVPAALSAVGQEITFLLLGEPGIGKTTVLKTMQELHGDKYHYVYIDGPATDYGDLSMKIPVHEEKALVQYVSERFPKDGKPFVVMIDEIGKMSRMMKLIVTRLMLEKSLGDWELPKGSIVFATSNNSTDGVGDNIEAHVGNRVSLTPVAKPTADEWLVWATDNNVHPIVRAWVDMNRECMRSYLEAGQDENPYIFNPMRGAVSFVSPRSLAKASVIIAQSVKLGVQFTQSALAGTVGASAANSMAALISLNEQIVPIKDVIKDPLTVPVSDNKAAILMTMFNACDVIETQDDLTAFMQFLDRVGSREIEGVFFTMLTHGKRTVRLARGNARVKEWSSKNIDLF